MDVKSFLKELKVAMEDESNRTMLDGAWYTKVTHLSTGEMYSFIARTDYKFRAYVFIPGNIVPGISWGQGLVIQTIENDFIGEVVPIVFDNNGIWEIAIPKTPPSRASNWGNPVSESTRASKNNKAVMHLFNSFEPIELGRQFADSAIITGWNPETALPESGGAIQTKIIILDDKSHLEENLFDWISVLEVKVK